MIILNKIIINEGNIFMENSVKNKEEKEMKTPKKEEFKKVEEPSKKINKEMKKMSNFTREKEF